MSDPLSVVASVAGLTSLAIEIFKVLNTYASDAKSAPTDINELLEKVEGLSAVLRQFESFLLDNDIDKEIFNETSALLSIITICNTKLENLDQKLKNKYPGKKVAQGFDNDQKSSEVTSKTKPRNLYQKFKKYLVKKDVPELINRLQWPFDKQECEDTIAALSQFTQIFNFSLNISNWYVLLYIAIESKYTP